jgi:hypothetical protein
MASHIDLAVTLLDMAGVPKPTVMDGMSWLHLLDGNDGGEGGTEKRNGTAWRTDLLIEYNGPSPRQPEPINSLSAARANVRESVKEEYRVFLDRALGSSSLLAKPVPSGSCGMAVTGHDVHTDCAGIGMCGGEHGECPCDATNNTYKCLRTINATENSIYCQVRLVVSS